MLRRELLGFCAVAAGAGVLTRIAPGQAQSLSGKQIRIVVPFPAGGPTDIVARPVAQMLGEALKATVVVDNRGGAGGSIGADAVAKSAPDGRTLLMATVGTHAINPALYNKLPYDAVRDFTPIALIAHAPVAIVVHPSQPVSNLAESGRARQTHAGQAQLRFGRRRHARPPHRRNVQGARRHRHPACTVQGQRTGGDRSDRRPDPDHVRSAAVGALEHARRQVARALPCQQQGALGGRCRMCRRSPNPATADLRRPHGGECSRRRSCRTTLTQVAGRRDRTHRRGATRSASRLEPLGVGAVAMLSGRGIRGISARRTGEMGQGRAAIPVQRSIDMMKLNDEEHEISWPARSARFRGTRCSTRSRSASSSAPRTSCR